MQQLIRNLSPLVGCKVDSIRWCPPTAYQVCKNLRLASLVCLDLNSDKFYKSAIKYKFENKISVETYNIHKAVMAMDPKIMDTTYILHLQDLIAVPDKISKLVSMHDALFLYSMSKGKNDSAIFDSLSSLSKLKMNNMYKYVMFILLDAYSLRYSLFKHFIRGEKLDYGELRKERITRLLNNIYYVKAKLEDFDPDLTTDLNNHITTLFYNVCLIKKKMEETYIEVGEL